MGKSYDGRPTFWRSDRTGIFLHERGLDDRPMFLHHVGIANIYWDVNKTGRCIYCGKLQPAGGGLCGGCQSDNWLDEIYMGKAIVTFFGRLPDPGIVALFHLDSDKPNEIYIDHKDCGGLRDEWIPYLVIMKFDNLKVVGRSMDTVVALEPSQASLLTVAIKIECDVELHIDGIEWDGQKV